MVIESSKFSGKHAWTVIRDIQKCYSGLSSVTIHPVCNDAGDMCSSLEEQWNR